MDFFDSPYFSVNKSLLTLIGLWPYQSRSSKILIRSIIGILGIVFVIPHFSSIFVNWGVDAFQTVQSVSIIIYITQTSSKMIMSVILEERIKKMFEKVAQNWVMLKDPEEIAVLHKHSKFGRFLTLSYLAYMFSALTGFITMPVLPLIFDLIAPLNESRPKIFILEGEYFIDRYQHYRAVFFFESFTCILSVFVFSAIDSTYAVCVQQCIGLMDIVKTRLNMPKINFNQTEIFGAAEKVATDDLVVQAAQYHQRAINFANTLEYTYALLLMFVLIMNATIFSVGTVLVIKNTDDPVECIRFTLIMVGLLIHIFYLSWPGQQLINASSSILETAYVNKWYNLSRKTQKILLFMMTRSQEPCQFTAGGVYVMNIANCGSLVKASFSYITVFSSMI